MEEIFDAALRRLFQAAPGEIAVLDPHFSIVAVNDACIREWKPREKTSSVRASSIPSSTTRPVRDRFASRSRGCSNTRASDKMAARPRGVPTACGPSDEIDERYESALNYPILDEDGRVINIVHQVEDVTELVLLRRARPRRGKRNSPKRSTSMRRSMTRAFLRAAWTSMAR